jgi:hypothetical protein
MSDNFTLMHCGRRFRRKMAVCCTYHDSELNRSKPMTQTPQICANCGYEDHGGKTCGVIYGRGLASGACLYQPLPAPDAGEPTDRSEEYRETLAGMLAMAVDSKAPWIPWECQIGALKFALKTVDDRRAERPADRRCDQKSHIDGITPCVHPLGHVGPHENNGELWTGRPAESEDERFQRYRELVVGEFKDYELQLSSLRTQLEEKEAELKDAIRIRDEQSETIAKYGFGQAKDCVEKAEAESAKYRELLEAAEQITFKDGKRIEQPCGQDEGSQCWHVDNPEGLVDLYDSALEAFEASRS